MKPEVEVFPHFFPEPMLHGLIDLIRASSIRKQEFEFSDMEHASTVPAVVIEAANYAADRLKLKFNTSTLKWYRTSDTQDSTAYEAHKDPDNLTSIPLVLCSLTGEADLIYTTSDGDSHTVHCTSNTVTVLSAKLLHRVTPPQTPDGERLFMFLGYDSNL